MNDLRAHFGLGSATTVDRIEVHWPTGESDTIKSVAANQIVTIQQGMGWSSAHRSQDESSPTAVHTSDSSRFSVRVLSSVQNSKFEVRRSAFGVQEAEAT
jgi:hypothetical protein